MNKEVIKKLIKSSSQDDILIGIHLMKDLDLREIHKIFRKYRLSFGRISGFRKISLNCIDHPLIHYKLVDKYFYIVGEYDESFKRVGCTMWITYMHIPEIKGIIEL